MTEQTVGEIAQALGAEAVGDLNIKISAVQEPAKAVSGQLALAMEPSYEDALRQGSASAAIVWPDADWQDMGLSAAIIAPRSRYVLSGVSYIFEHKPEIASGIHPTAIVDPTAKIGANAAIGPFCVVGARVVIGDNLRMVGHCTIGEDAVIGDNALMYSGVRIGARVHIGHGFISQSNTVVGADGFSYVTPQPGAVEEAKKTGKISEHTRTDGFARINSLGAVHIGDNVEMGANCTIDRGTIANTTIGNGTKLDNLVHIGHNVVVGQTCLICGQVGIAGSSVIGDRVVLGGQVGVADHINIGSDVIAAGKSGISSNVPAGRVMMGNPAMKMDLNIQSYTALRRLPRLVAKVAELQKSVSKILETK
ncbi:UDP-3-O-(3-hydroxymyristoyl)glucosamine N-acyltransferase [Amylibacter kogurei]|uniref:UDP-3-O-acylglucosamine N-acyltransferase n=1 Tax=Paramylibacter kogurei TaxID=1889778 RepID=A0A2G5K6K2_9RHOB|nr:UDP-3-O-(3-hydroxymyristoyl)glucosamine N-acyltransferase [Amylibacter kogurei]PIB24642.1 UDP-3-O-(3-hydroxymyristoyl)glucosamine N-acyltransferase [Amylibacter kogurei]